MMTRELDSVSKHTANLVIHAEESKENTVSSTDQQKHVDFTQMPQEILVHIFSYIDADFLINVVSLVSKYLRDMLSSDQYWKMRLFKKFPQEFPIVHDSNFSMADTSKECISCWKIWKKSNGLQNNIVLSQPSGCTVDCIHLTEDRNLCICGGRDHNMTVWKLDPEPGANINAGSEKVPQKHLNHHKGWVWSINSRPGEICSTSFDTTIKLYDAHGLEMTRSIRAQAPVLCSTYIDEYTIAAGCSNAKTVLVDTRSGTIIHSDNFHKRSVLKIESESNYTVSTGEDGVLIIADIREMKIVQKGFAMAMNSSGKQIWTGSKTGLVQVFNVKNPNLVYEAARLDYGFSGKVTALRYTSGAVYAGSTDGWLKIFQPTLRPDCLGELQLQSDGVTDISVLDKRLAVSAGNGMVALWDPASTPLSEDPWDQSA